MTGEPAPRRNRRAGPLVLVGLMGAGKSTVGRRLAASCGLRFVDLDEEISRRAGQSVPEVFAQLGERAFRELEARATAEIATAAAESRGLVVAAGGGWMANGPARAALPGARTVWLSVGPREAARRLATERDERPLLAGVDPAARLAELLAERLPAYREATYTVDTMHRTPDDVAREIAATAGLEPER